MAELAEGGGLLNRYSAVKVLSRVRIPLSPPPRTRARSSAGLECQTTNLEVGGSVPPSASESRVPCNREGLSHFDCGCELFSAAAELAHLCTERYRLCAAGILEIDYRTADSEHGHVHQDRRSLGIVD